MKHLIQSMLFAVCFTAACLLTGCNTASITGPDEAPQTQSCEDDSCSNGHNF